MTREEDLVRSTASAIAETVREVPPLRLSAAPAPGAPRPSAPRVRRLRSWLAPVAAAAAVLALAISLVAIKSLHSGPVPAAARSGSAVAVPTYYVAPEASCTSCQSTRLVVADTRTGAKLATVDPPRGTSFVAVSAAADDRTFVAATVGYPFKLNQQQVTWYLVKITPDAATPVRMTRLSIPNTPPASSVGTVALSPSGGELAVTYQFRQVAPSTIALRIYSVSSGRLLHSWSTTTSAVPHALFHFAPFTVGNNDLNWVDGGRALSFTTVSDAGNTSSDSRAQLAVRTLNMAAADGDLIRDSRVVWSTRYQANELNCADGLNSPRLSADGRTVVCAEGDNLSTGADRSVKHQAFPIKWLTYQISDPSAVRILREFTVHVTGSHREALTSVQWANGSGSTLIVSWFVRSTTYPTLHFGVISHGTYTPLPTPPGILLGTPPNVAW